MSGATAEQGVILVVDDTPTNLEVLFNFLTDSGFKILIAEDGESAIQKAEYASPDLILLDIMMPGIDGFETCCRLKASQSTRDIPVIFLTALSDTVDKVRGLQLGAVDYITKPLQHEEVLARVQTHLRLRNLTKQLQQQNLQLEREIKERQRYEEALRQSEQRFQLIARATNDAVWDWDLLTNKVWWNEGIQTLFGYAPEQVGSDVTWWYDQIHPEERSRVVSGIQAAIARGEFFWLDEYRYRRANGSYAYVIDRAYVNYDALSRPVRMLGGMTDITERIRTQQELARSNAELQQFASIASHDLQEPLRKIQVFGSRLKEKCSSTLSEQGCDYIDRMQNAAQRMQILIDDLLIFSRISTRAQPFVPVNLADVTKEVLSDLEVLIQQTGGRVEVSELPTIDAEPLQMRQLFQNLIGNALKFHQENEPPQVRIYSQIVGGQEQQSDENLVGANLCQITVEDYGIGFDEKYLDRIFQVFQRLHSRSEYEGTGMGLAICRKIVERHNGSITAESTSGKGAKFIVTLPVLQVSVSH